MRLLDPKNDLTFKKIFGEHPHLLKSFLNAVLPLPDDAPIESLDYLPSELIPQVPLFKNTIVDVRCVDTQGRQFIVEMQMLWTDSFKSRVLFNASTAYVRQLNRGEKYEGLKPVYALSLVNEIFEPTLSDYYHHYKIVHLQHPARTLEGLEFIFVELPKIQATTFSQRRLQILWLRFLSEIKDGTEQVSLSDEFNRVDEIREALTYLEESSFSKAQLEAYDRYWDSISTEKTYRADIAKMNAKLQLERERLAEEQRLIDAQKQQVESEKQQVESEKQQVESEKQQVESEKQQVESEKQQVESEKQQLKIDRLNFARSLKAAGISTKDIVVMSGLSEDEVQLL
jgi:predicted transposase/invertase (TIGR01784 family)